VKTASLGSVTVFQLRLLGPFEATHEGDKVALPARKSEALLALLGLRPGVELGREWLTAQLWPDVPEAQGRTSLRQALGHLRKSFSDELLVGSADKLHLDPASAWVDAAELARLLQRPPIERAGALELWRGELLEGFPAIEEPFTHWLADERTRLKELFSTRMEECLAALSAKGDRDLALAVAARLIEVEPTRESAHRALMRLHWDRGDRAAAVRQYERCRELLQRHLDLSPGAETEQLRLSITDQPPPSLSAPSAVSAADLGERLLLAVLPFAAASDDPQTQLLARGLTEDVTTELARFRQLALIARACVAEVAEKSTSPEHIARETAARLMLTGSVLASAARVRVTAALVDCTTALQLWAERWEVPQDDFLVVLERLTKSLVGALALRIDEARLEKARRRPRERLEVYECWLRGLECLRRGTPASDDEARSLFEQALGLAPDFARAFSGISLSHFNDWSCQAWDRWDERERLAFVNARKAVELDDEDHVTHMILARIYSYRREFELGERHVEHAIGLNSNDTSMLMQASLAYAQLGNAERACELSRMALRLHPKHPDWYYPIAAFAELIARNPEAAVRLGLRAPDGLVDTRAMLAIACVHLNDATAARDHARRFLEHFRVKITPGRQSETGEPARWFLRVNPLRRSSDEQYLLDGLVRAGIDPP
jgi:DNA-binding SARP family transcriptional activator